MEVLFFSVLYHFLEYEVGSECTAAQRNVIKASRSSESLVVVRKQSGGAVEDREDA